MLETFSVNLAGRVRRETLNGRRYLVAPMSLLPLNGVLHGSQGPLFYPEQETRNTARDWDYMPLVVWHPTDRQGNHVSARDPGIIENWGVGFNRKTVVNGRLSSEGWYDEEKTRLVDNKLVKRGIDPILPRLLQSKPIELSTGLYTDNEAVPEGTTYNGTPYEFIARNYRPDHIAILPDQKGACSNEQGCGVMVNEQVSNAWSEEAREAAAASKAAKAATKNAPSVPAHAGLRTRELSAQIRTAEGKGIFAGPPNHTRIAQEHTRLAEAHENAIKPGEPGGGVHREAATAHRIAAGLHERAAGVTGNTMNKTLLERFIETAWNLVTGNANPEGHNQYSSGAGASEQIGRRVQERTQRENDAKKEKEKEDEKKSQRARLVAKLLGRNELESNAGRYGNPQHQETGQFMEHGAGTGKGEVHEAAKGGYGRWYGDEHLESPAQPTTAYVPAQPKPAEGQHHETDLTNDEWNKMNEAALKGGSAKDALDDNFGGGMAGSSGSTMGGGSGGSISTLADPSQPRQPKAVKPPKAVEFGAADTFRHNQAPQGVPMGPPTSFTPAPAPDPHDASKQAAGATVQTEHPGARDQALQAMDHSGAGKDKKAAVAHEGAAETHEDAATEARTQGDHDGADQHDNAAALHRKAASMHRAGAIGQTANMWSDEAREAAAEARKHGYQEQKGAVERGSLHARGEAPKPGEADNRPAVHVKPSGTWAHYEGGGGEEPETTGKGAKSLREHLQKFHGTHNQEQEATMPNFGVVAEYSRGQALRLLTANCSCEADKLAYNKMSDDELKRLLKQIATPPVGNAKKAVTEEGGGERGQHITEGSGSAAGSKHEEIEDEYDEQGVKIEKKPAMEKNSRAVMNRWFNDPNVPEPVKEAARENLLHVRNQKIKLVTKLITNVATEQRQEVGNQLMRKDLTELRMLVSLIPTTNEDYLDESYPAVANYGLVAGGAAPVYQLTENEAADTLPLTSEHTGGLHRRSIRNKKNNSGQDEGGEDEESEPEKETA